ncbi:MULTISPECIES: hypothetical protein [Sphingobium]|uniref:DUF5983 domain-containing protein n=3 Tax=Sphingobium TaxID=165695 RepID=A0A6P1GE32_SPHYA|nr:MULTISPECIES: hypothetical protein [Sphingobium]EQB16520.1 hypothetical protein RLDS_06810 [Sphingobium lactosutens DS20]QDC36658.1 hypothetical protein FIL70_04790 [Sphingobium fuliginis ATCC 27551]QHD66755.1 hypothetical protein GS397_06610 [Sphingobium yanoikuyae]QNG43856.1 hypothetical protein H3V42_18235 [Sphingobium yanoikuyae]
MTQMTRHDFARLLARARAAIVATEAPDRMLCQELEQAERVVESHIVPWSADIHAAFIDHRDGGSLYAAFTRAALMAEVSEFCREWWTEIRDKRDPAKLSDEEICSAYFDGHDHEYLWSERITVEAPVTAAWGELRVGRHLVISTSHIRPATADLLDQWAPMISESRPLGVAEAGHGWFVLTDPLDVVEREMVPAELWAAISFARAQGCRWLLLDRDADTVAGLDTFDW